MLKHDPAYSVYEYRKKHVCDNEMQYSIIREGILMYYRNFLSTSR